MRRRAKPRFSGQVNVPLAAEDEEVLHALTYLENASRAELLAPVVAKHLRREAARPDVAKAIEARRIGAPEEKKITPIESARRKRGQAAT